MYPVDHLPALDSSELTSASEQYLSTLQMQSVLQHDNIWIETFHSKVEVTGPNVSRLLLFEDDQLDCVLPALKLPGDHTQVVALYLNGKWWSVDDVLRSTSKSRDGLVLVQSLVERVILYLLSQVVEKLPEEEALFRPHPSREHGKLLWRTGEAVGFYTIKQKGSLCDGCTSQSYLLPVLDTVLVRSSRRRSGLGLQMLEDFCSSFPTEEVLGVSSPLSHSMVAVCRKFLQKHDDQRERLYEVEAPGGWAQRRNIWLNIQLGRYPFSVDEKKNPMLSGDSMKNEGHNTQCHTQSQDARQEAESSEDTGDFYSAQRPLPIDSHIKVWDPSQVGSAPSAKPPTKGCISAAHVESQNIELSPRLRGPPKKTPAVRTSCGGLESESSGPTEPMTIGSSNLTTPGPIESPQSLKPRREKEELLRCVKRVRMTLK